jgi:RHS repeat-associated protein
MCDGSGATSWAHDEMGRVLTEQRIIVGSSAITKSVGYTYYKDGELHVLTYPGSSRQMTYIPNSSGGYTAGRIASVVDTTNGVNHVTVAKYAPQGGITSLTIGTSVNGAETYNARMQPLQMYYTTGTITNTTLNQLQNIACPAATATIMSRSYNVAQGLTDNGTVQSIANCRDNNRTQNFFYDSLNRINQAYTTGNSPLSTSWGETFTIDAWSNLTNKGPVTGKTYTEMLNVAPASVKNQVSSYCNDSAGNLVLNAGCPSGPITPTYSYDAEGRLTGTNGVTYTYDGDGKRVKKSNGMLYWAGTGSAALLETDLSGNPTAEYVFFNGTRLARIDRPANTVEYYFSDHLGSADVVTNANGSTILKESDYYPYGGEISIISGDSNRYKFSGKERDSESNLDNFGARYNASNLGRFMTPDGAARPTAVPYAVFGDPQSLNLYGYVRNDPVSRADLDGHYGAEQDAVKDRHIFDDGSAFSVMGFASPLSEVLSLSNAQVQEIRDAQKAQSDARKAQNESQAQTQQNQTKRGEAHSGEPYSARQQGTPDTSNPNVKVYHYQIVDPSGKHIQGKAWVSEDVKTVFEIGEHDNQTRSNLPITNGRFDDRMSAPDAPKSPHDYQKTEQTFTVEQNGQVYHLTTKVNQYIDVAHGNVTIKAEVVIP